MALTKVITGVTDLNQAQSTNGLKFPTGSVFAGTPEEGMIRNDQSQSSETSSSTMQFYNGTAWKNFVNKTPIPLGSDNFNTVLYTGNGGTQAITNVGFEPNLTWIKQRNGTGRNILTDSVRGVTKYLFSELPSAEVIYGSNIGLTSFDSDGFTVADPGALNYSVNGSGKTYVAWSWKAGGAAVSNTDGTITSQVSANVDAGFSIVKYTGNGTIPSTVAHGLDSAPELIIVKVLNQSYPWNVFSASIGNTKYLKLNEAYAEASNISRWNNTSPTSAVFTIGNDGDVNGNGLNYIAYAFHSVDGYSKMGSYTGNGSSTGPTIVTGFEPAWVMFKRTDSTSGWNIQDNKRNSTNPRTGVLQAQSNAQEYTSSTYAVDFNSNGFQIVNSDNGWNTSGGTYIYMAFAAT